MKIPRVEAIPFAIPYRKPLRFASGEVATAEHVLVRVHTDDGVVGTAEAPPRPFTYGETQAVHRAVVADLFAPAARRASASSSARSSTPAWSARSATPRPRRPSTWRIWDAIGQTLGVSVSELLGGFTDRMRVSHMVGFAPAEEMVAEAERMRDEHGITTFKVKVGRRPLTARRRRLPRPAASARRRTSSSTSTATGAGPPPSRPARCSEMADLDLTFAEELCPADDVLGRRWLVAAVDDPDRSPTRASSRPGEVTRELLGGAATGDQHQDRPDRVHHQPAGARPVRGTGRRGRHGQPDRRPGGLAVRRRVRRRLRSSPPAGRPSCPTSST